MRTILLAFSSLPISSYSIESSDCTIFYVTRINLAQCLAEMHILRSNRISCPEQRLDEFAFCYGNACINSMQEKAVLWTVAIISM